MRSLNNEAAQRMQTADVDKDAKDKGAKNEPPTSRRQSTEDGKDKDAKDKDATDEPPTTRRQSTENRKKPKDDKKRKKDDDKDDDKDAKHTKKAR